MPNVSQTEAEIADGLNRSIVRRKTDSPEVAERLNTMSEHVIQNMVAIQRKTEPRKPMLQTMMNEIVQRPLPPTVKYARLWKMADTMAPARVGHQACKKGCSHCCYINLPLTNVEAELIGKRIGRTPATVVGPVKIDPIRNNYNSPCPFLRNEACSIYEHRPLVCRNHVNLDVDNLLCRLTGDAVTVPLLNNQTFTDLELRIAAESETVIMADIRDWFPPR